MLCCGKPESKSETGPYENSYLERQLNEGAPAARGGMVAEP